MLDKVLEILKTSNLFLTGGGGVGKSYLVLEIIKHYQKNSKKVIVLGSTGISAVGIGGVTLHSFFKIGICSNYEELKIYDKKNKQKLKELNEILKSCDLIVIDEISMVSADIMELIYYRIANSEFNGKFILVGDFYQLPPVKKQSLNTLFDLTYAFSSNAWNNLNLVNIELCGSKRTDDKIFYDFLSKLRVGNVGVNEIIYLKSFLKNNINYDDSSVLFGTNAEVDKLNMIKLQSIDSQLEISSGYFEIYDENLNENILQKWINNLNITDELKIKIGAKIIFTTNKWGEFFNGQRGEIVDIIKNYDTIDFVKVLMENGNTIDIIRQKYDLSEYAFDGNEMKENVRASYFQFPFKLAYAITIHKSQGMSINNLTCNLDKIFVSGQLYVALSRSSNPKNLKIIFNRSENFENYIKKNATINSEVANFYAKNSFINL
ncbi:glycosysltransferase [Campylobacter sputorum subsp. bubulus]|uniref:Glycosysltransferase n=1 Tax=Campylobacter sputorum subsp. sputorum TaxID=32024 RepID=A0A381DH27_9BACT|nr:AAA family ATPase [Campylobacter sputorum]ASM35079.1 putative helicase, PIF1 family (DUF889 domain) [Campylobacter sputorum aubsp. sputorum RM3237]KAB0581319.1 AAA family ATPase [Campylobacter sputorum subsp. sputorum]QEL05269.1 PIF1-like helicase [Campylobacter sputorum subsp. sputorum]SUX08931.1 glycosysltransferase [Campylobacter sputorum subsp. bubulus]SUX09774.1 glycosysltransferase [Campylobacter sputorum subsp. sputorum]